MKKLTMLEELGQLKSDPEIIIQTAAKRLEDWIVHGKVVHLHETAAQLCGGNYEKGEMLISRLPAPIRIFAEFPPPTGRTVHAVERAWKRVHRSKHRRAVPRKRIRSSRRKHRGRDVSVLHGGSWRCTHDDLHELRSGSGSECDPRVLDLARVGCEEVYK